MTDTAPPSDRAVSPVVGSVLLLAIVVLLVGVSAVVFFGAADTQQPAPEAHLTLSPVDGSGTYHLEMTSGETIDGDQLRLVGVADPDTLDGRTLTAGSTVDVDPKRETVRVVWRTDAGDDSTYTLATFSVDPGSGPGGPTGPSGFPDGTVFTGSSGDIISVAGDGGSVSTLVSSGSVTAMGAPSVDVTGDGAADLPYVDSSGTVRVIDADGSRTRVVDQSAISGDIETNKTRVAVAAWDGAPASVFFVNENHDTIYRATPGGSPTVVATPGNGAQSVVGAGDIDADGEAELVFGDASQTLRYLEPGGATVTTGVSTGSSTGIGTGTVADFDGDGQARVAIVDGGNYVQFVDDTGGAKVTSGDVAGSSAPQATKSPTAAADVDGDDATELVYVGAADGDLKYLDDIATTIEIEYLTDEDGDRIDGSALTGAT